MRRCAYLTTEDLTGYFTDDDLTFEPLRALGWEAVPVPWRSQRDWSSFDAVVVRTTWDYQHDAAAFRAALEAIDRQTVLLNPLSLMLWNMRKTYLRDLSDHGVLIPPTLWLSSPSAEMIEAAFSELGTEEIVVKPQVGASANDTLRVRLDGRHPQDHLHGDVHRVADLFRGRDCMVQPFLERVLTEGETSVILFNGDLSHVITKTPQRGDFRVQEEHGGTLLHVEPEPGVVERAHACIAALDSAPLYARTDFVRTADGDYALMELEVIEPSLYFRLDPASPARFAAALAARMEREAAA